MLARLNAKFITDYGDLIKDCNKWVAPYTEANGVWNFPIPVGNIQVIPPTFDAIQLLDPGLTVNGTWNKREQSNVTIQRFIISHVIAEEYLAGEVSLLPYIKTALDNIHQIKGFSHNQLSYGDYYISFQRIGYPEGSIFAGFEHRAGFELRALSNNIRPGMNIGVINE